MISDDGLEFAQVARSAQETAAVSIEVMQMREVAGQVLRQLLIDRALSEQRQAERGATDPIKTITGHSALDDAIDTTQGIIRRIDGAVGEERSRPAPAPSPAPAATPVASVTSAASSAARVPVGT